MAAMEETHPFHPRQLLRFHVQLLNWRLVTSIRAAGRGVQPADSEDCWAAHLLYSDPGFGREWFQGTLTLQIG